MPARAQVGTPADATRDAEVVLLAVQWRRVDDVLSEAGNLSRKVLLSCSLPMSKDDTHVVIGHTSSGAETLAAKVRSAQVVPASSTVPTEVLFPVFEKWGKGAAPDLIYCGDDKGAKSTAARLICDVGFNPVDTLPTRMTCLHTNRLRHRVCHRAMTKRSEDSPFAVHRQIAAQIRILLY
jgi:predicted dinucleotide-binding enzyme